MLGIPNASDLNGIITNLGTIVASLGPEEQAVLNAAILQLSDHADALEDKAIAALKAAEDPLLARIDAATAVAATLAGILQQVVDRGLMLTVPKVAGVAVSPGLIGSTGLIGGGLAPNIMTKETP